MTALDKVDKNEYKFKKSVGPQTRKLELVALVAGYLTESELEHYITELLPTLSQLDGLEKSFHNFYICTAVRKFIFFLDGARANRVSAGSFCGFTTIDCSYFQVRIIDILACSFLDDLLELRDENVSKDVQEQNWFSAPSALRIYGEFCPETSHFIATHSVPKCQVGNYGFVVKAQNCVRFEWNSYSF